MAWFKPKRYGLGAYPASWQGWALTAGYLAIVAGLGVWMGGDDAARATSFVIITLMISIVFVGIAWRTTEGGWRWRWGDND